MQTNDLLDKAKAGDKQALIDWSREYKLLIARLAYQSGIPEVKIGQIQFEVIKRISSDIKEIDNQNAENKIMESTVQVIRKLQNNEPNDKQEASLLKFPEDLETHTAIQKLPLLQRLTVILANFHGKTAGEISAILNEPVASIESDNGYGREMISKGLFGEIDSNVQKRFELLAKSYNRISFPEAQEDMKEEAAVVEEVELAGKTEKIEKSSFNKKTIATLAGASLFLSAIIGSSFLFNEQPAELPQTASADDGEKEKKPTTVSKQMVKEWEQEYEEVRASSPERLGLSQEAFEQLDYVKKADDLKKRTLSRENVKQLRDDPKRMQEQVEVLMRSIETPQGMLDSVNDYSLLSSEVGSFLLTYTEKTEELMEIANNLLEEYEEELSEVKVNGHLSPEKLLSSRDEYPEEIENLTAALNEYNFQLIIHPNEERFRTIRDVHQFYDIHPFNADMLSTYYVDILQNTPVFDETGMLWPIEQLPYSVIMMATFMSDPVVDPELKGKVEPHLTQAFYTLLKGNEQTEIFDNNGVIKEEFQIAWESLMQHNNNPITFLMLPILEEFEASGWKESARYEQLEKSDILYAIDLESNGELAGMLPNGDVNIESTTLQLNEYDDSEIKAFYEKFAAAHDRKILSGVEPMKIIELYYYANKIKDAETMWHLTADDKLKTPLEEYLKTWKQKPDLSEIFRSIEIYKENTHREGRKVYLMAFGEPKNFDNTHRLPPEIRLVTEKDQIWLMQHQMNEFYLKDENFEPYDSNVQNYYKDIARTGETHSVQSASPAEIAAVFLLALEKEDVKTMRLLLNETDNPIEDEVFKERWLKGEFPVYSKVSGVSFQVDSFSIGIDSIHGHLEIILNDGTMENSRYMPMIKIGESWMVDDVFGH